jgi:hypothetical protein
MKTLRLQMKKLKLVINKEENEQELEVENNEENENEIEELLNENQITEEPKVGMMFNSEEDVRAYYTRYAKQKGFGVSRRTSKLGDDGKSVKYFTLSCVCQGKAKSRAANPLKPQPKQNLGCKAKINASRCLDGRFMVSTVVLEHNHILSPGKARYFRCHKNMNPYVKRRLELLDKTGVRVSKNYQSLVIEAGGFEKLPFGEKDARNHIDKARRLRLGVGGAEALRNYFARMQEKDDRFYYVMDLDDKCRLRNVFWADARSRATYEYFGDVISFDTTYLTNTHKMPFAPFVGVNHHGQSILLGCGLLSNEDTNTFIWLFESWLKCMSGRAPNAIITDQDKAMQKAIEIVFPKTKHRFCLWHIMEKLPHKFSGHSQYEAIKKNIQHAVYDSLTRDEFEESWQRLLEMHNLQQNEWLQWLYDERYHWVPAYVKNTFWAGMSTTQRSESTNAFFDGYVGPKTTLKQFVDQYDNA